MQAGKWPLVLSDKTITVIKCCAQLHIKSSIPQVLLSAVLCYAVQYVVSAGQYPLASYGNQLVQQWRVYLMPAVKNIQGGPKNCTIPFA